MRHHTPSRKRSAVELDPVPGLYLRVLPRSLKNSTAFGMDETYLETASSLVSHSQHVHVAFQVGDITDQVNPDFDRYCRVLCSEMAYIPRKHTNASITGLWRIMSNAGILILSFAARWSLYETSFRENLSLLCRPLSWLICHEPVSIPIHMHRVTRTRIHKSPQKVVFTTMGNITRGIRLPILIKAGLGLKKSPENSLKNYYIASTFMAPILRF